MNEAEWVTCSDSEPMLTFLVGKTHGRKIRLFACACCHRVFSRLEDERSRKALEAAEQFAENAIPENVLYDAQRAAWDVHWEAARATSAGTNSEKPCEFLTQAAAWVAWWEPNAAWRRADDNERNAAQTCWAVVEALANQKIEAVSSDQPWQELQSLEGATRKDEKLTQSKLLRDIFGNPFRPVAVDPSWLTSTVVALAKGIYDEKAFDRLPILADALQDAGCENTEVLEHCRGPGPHVRGCWVVDALLGKE